MSSVPVNPLRPVISIFYIVLAVLDVVSEVAKTGTTIAGVESSAPSNFANSSPKCCGS